MLTFALLVVRPSHPSIIYSNNAASIQNCHLVAAITGNGAADKSTAIQATRTKLIAGGRAESRNRWTSKVPDTCRSS